MAPSLTRSDSTDCCCSCVCDMFVSTNSPHSAAAPDTRWDEQRIQAIVDKIAADRRPGNIVLNVLLSDNSTYRTQYLTRITFIPCLLITLLSSLLVMFLIKRYLRDCFVLYFSVLIYAATQVLLFLAIILDLALSYVSLSSLEFCKIRSTAEVLTMILSAYSICGMTVVRFIFIQKPLHYRNILRLQYQILVLLVEAGISLGIAVSPLLGLCELTVHGDKYCHYRSEGGPCRVFHTVVVVVGISLPVVLTVAMYGVIYRSIYRLKKTQKRFQPTHSRENLHSNSSSGTSKDTARTLSSNLPSDQALEQDILSNTGNTDHLAENTAQSDQPPHRNDDPAAVHKDEKSSTRHGSDEKSLLGVLVNRHYKEDSVVVRRRKPSQILSPTLSNINSQQPGDRVYRKVGSLITESRQVPWSIMTVLVLYIGSTLPWAALITAPELWYGSLSVPVKLLLDLKYCVMFIGIAASPIATIVTTKALRKAFIRFLKTSRRYLRDI